MKLKNKPHICLAGAILLLFACEKKEALNHETTIEQSTLLAPANDTAIILNADQAIPIIFSWRKTKVGDGTLAFYKVLFDTEAGDFSNPLMEKIPDSLGTAASVQLSRSDLDSLSKLAGAQQNAPVKIKWMVLATNGVSNAQSLTPFTFSLQIAPASEANILMTAADQLMDTVTAHFLEGMPLDIWGEYYPRRDSYWDGASTVWGQGAAFSGYTALKRMATNHPALKAKYENLLDDRLLTSIDKFRNRRNGGPEAFAVFPGDGDERFYDDNVWIGLDMVDLYLLTKDQKYLERARIVWNFILSGADNLMGGGVYWKEGEIGKNTCSTAPSAVLGLKLYMATSDQAYLDKATEFYQWVKNTLQDPADQLFWDNVKLSDPADPNSSMVTDQSKFAYNAGQPMQAAVLLYKVTGDASYLYDAKKIAEAAYQKWFKPFHSDALNEDIRMWNDNNIWFNTILLRGYIELYSADGNDQYVSTYKKILLHAWSSEAHNKATNLLNTDFTGTTPQTEWPILYQGACVELLARLAELEIKKQQAADNTVSLKF